MPRWVGSRLSLLTLGWRGAVVFLPGCKLEGLHAMLYYVSAFNSWCMGCVRRGISVWGGMVHFCFVWVASGGWVVVGAINEVLRVALLVAGGFKIHPVRVSIF